MGTRRWGVLWGVAVVAALGVGYGVGAYLGPGRADEVVEQPASDMAEVMRPTADPVPAAVENWGDHVGPSVYILRRAEARRMEADAALRARVMRFREQPEVIAARVYRPEGPEWPKGPTDVYLVGNRTDMQSELHGIYWYSPVDDPDGTACHERWALGAGGSHGLTLLDVDGDGRREVITSMAGVNTWGVAIVDLFAPDGAVGKYEGLPFTQNDWWKFADLDDDGIYEAVTVGPAWVVRGMEPDETKEQRVFAVYSFSEGEWSLSDVLEDDPTLAQ